MAAASVKQKDFSKGSMWKIIMAQSVPLMFAQLIQLLYNVVDRIYIGHLPDIGPLALTGIGLTFPFVSLILAFSNLYGSGGSPLFSIARGAGDNEKAKGYMGNSFTLIIITAVVVMILFYIFRIPILYLFGASDVTVIYAENYLKIYLLGVIFSMTVTGMNPFISALGFPTTAMWTTIIGAVLNLILDPIFIFGLSLGVQGAAAATVISQFVSAVWVFRFMLTNNTGFTLIPSYMRLKLQNIKDIVSLGVSGFVQQATNSVEQIVCNVNLQIWGGDVYVGIMTIINSVREVAYLPVQGLKDGSVPVLGFNYGAERNDRVKDGIRFMSLSGVAYTGAIWLLIQLFPGIFIRIFSNDPETLSLGIPAIRLYFIGFVFMALMFVGQGSFVGLGRSKQAVFFSIFRKIVIVLPLTFILPTIGGLGTNGVFLAEPVSNFIGGLFCYLTMYFTLYRKL